MPLFRPDQIATDTSDRDGSPCGPCKALLLSDGVTPMRPGDTATFRAGDPAGHCLENARDAEARFLVIGTRSSGNTVTYPDHDRVLHFDRESGDRRWMDHSGQPAYSPYRSETG